MGEAFITRRGGVADATPPPTIKFVSKTDTSITFTITNNSLKARDITHGLTTPPTTTTINLAALATSSNQTISNLDNNEQYFIFAQAEDSAITEFKVTLGTLPVFTAATGGTTLEYDSGGKRFKSHTFLEDGNFVVSTVGDNVDDRNKVDYLIIAGGGGGGEGSHAGGGGAGGFKTTVTPVPSDQTADSKFTVTAITFGVVVGGGGGTTTTGTNSSVFSQAANGGGGGGNVLTNGKNGGSGGGGGGSNVQNHPGGTGVLGQGRNGGSGLTSTIITGRSGGGGGGAAAVGGVGTTQTDSPGGNGGNGLANNLRTGSNETRAGGGGGGGGGDGAGGIGGIGGGGAGGNINATKGLDGTTNTGGGGGGARTGTGDNGGTGGSGIVVIRYEIAPSV